MEFGWKSRRITHSVGYNEVIDLTALLFQPLKFTASGMIILTQWYSHAIAAWAFLRPGIRLRDEATAGQAGAVRKRERVAFSEKLRDIGECATIFCAHFG